MRYTAHSNSSVLQIISRKILRSLIVSFLFLFSCGIGHSYESWTATYPSLPNSSDQREVDIVFTWVNGNDPKWCKERNSWAEREGLLGNISIDATDECRFRDNDELKYALRSVHFNAPFIRHIFIVTSGQMPKWLKPHPKITVVPHSHFFRDKRDLPTFNSHAIESNLHIIYRLAEHYIYMNDDFFLGKPTRYEDFYSKDGKKFKVFFTKNRRLENGLISQDDSGYTAALKNISQLLDLQFGKKKRYAHSHTPFPQIKSTVLEIESEFKSIFTNNSQHRFRSLYDYPITNGLIPYVALYQGKAEEGTASRITVSFGKNYESDAKKLEKIATGKYTFFCLNDTSDQIDAKSHELIAEFLQAYFPNPAPWEAIEEEVVEKGLFQTAKKIVKKKIASHKKRIASLRKITKKVRRQASSK